MNTNLKKGNDMNQETLDKMLSDMRKESFANTPQITLGELLDQVKDIPTNDGDEKVTIEFDFGTAYPSGLSSWRGSYNEIAVNYSLGGYDNDNADQFAHKDLDDFITEVTSAIGSTYQGWKGGDYSMTKDTPVWVANDGNVGNTAVIGVLNKGYKVVILTAYCEY